MRIRWTDEMAGEHLRAAVAELGLSRMPTVSELRSIGRGPLATRLCRTGGMDGWADRAGLARAQHASRKGWRWEEWFAGMASGRGLDVERSTRCKCPWDMKINGKTVDVKMANGRDHGHGLQWTWRIESEHRCEVYVFIALAPNQPPVIYIAEDSEVPRTCTTIMRHRARWHDKWQHFDAVKDF